MFSQRKSIPLGLLFAGCLAALAGCGDSATGDPSPSPSPSAPAAPSALSATAGNAQVSLHWTASANATSYSIKRATNGGGPFAQLSSSTTTSYMDSQASNGVTYFYVASAMDAEGESADSSEVSATPEAPSVTAAVPLNLKATAGNAQVVLTWSASSGATGYNVKRAAKSGGPYTEVAATTVATYTDGSVSNGTTYYYVISALDSAGESANSAQVSAAPAAPASNSTSSIPGAPTGLSAAAGNGNVALTWSASSNATGYHLKRGMASGGPYTQIAAPSSGSYTDGTAVNGSTYYYVVSAVNSAGESANSTQVKASPVAPVSIPAAPANLKATAGNSNVNLTWSVSSGASAYNVKRSTVSGGPYARIASSASASYTDASLTNGTIYYYVVSAADSAGESANSSQASATPVAAASSGGLHISGNQIVNSQNQAVQLRGVDKSGSEYMCLSGSLVFDGPSDAASVSVLKTWAVNIVRLPLNEDCWLGINGVATGGSAYQAAIAAYVNLLTAANIATILDLQWAAPGTTLSNQLTPMPDADHASAFWTSVANEFKGNGSVLFDLFNEPYPDNNSDSAAAWTCLKNGGTCPGVSYTAVGTQSLVNTIRATGSTNIIMVPGVQYTNVLDQWLAYMPTDPLNSLAASWHSYANQICNNSSCWTNVIQPLMASVPLVAGEIGENDCADVYVDPLMSFLDSHGGNYLAWAWNTYDCSSFPGLLSSYDGTPTAFGAGFRAHLLGTSN